MLRMAMLFKAGSKSWLAAMPGAPGRPYSSLYFQRLRGPPAVPGPREATCSGHWMTVEPRVQPFAKAEQQRSCSTPASAPTNPPPIMEVKETVHVDEHKLINPYDESSEVCFAGEPFPLSVGQNRRRDLAWCAALYSDLLATSCLTPHRQPGWAPAPDRTAPASISGCRLISNLQPGKLARATVTVGRAVAAFSTLRTYLTLWTCRQTLSVVWCRCAPPSPSPPVQLLPCLLPCTLHPSPARSLLLCSAGSKAVNDDTSWLCELPCLLPRGGGRPGHSSKFLW